MNRIFSRVAASLGVACLVLAPLPGESSKAGCRPVRHHHAHQQAAVVFQPVYQQPYWYQVGANYQVAAIVQETLKAQQLLAQQQLQAPQQAAPCPTCPTPQSMPLTAAPDRWALVRANCAGCHSTNEKAMSHVDMTDLSLLTCEQKLAMSAALLDGVMPPKKSLDPALMGNLLGEIVGAQSVEK